MPVFERMGRGIENIANVPVNLVQEVVRIFPDGLLMSVGFFSLITLSFSYGVFFMALLESLAGFHLLRGVNSYLNMSTILPSKASYSEKCVSGFMSKSLESLSLFGSTTHSAFPSAPIYMLAVASSYILATLLKFSKELEVLGPQFSSRFYVAAISLPLFLVSFMLFRLYFGCDDFSVLILSAVVGILLGFLLAIQNERLFGLNSLNLIGVPILRERTADGQKLYVCSQPPA